MNSLYHSRASARRFGGTPDQFHRVHLFLDSSKTSLGDVRHRALYHHTQGVMLCEQLFGPAIEVRRSTGKVVWVPTRLIAEQHIIEDLGWLPSPADYLQNMQVATWMSGGRVTEHSLSILYDTTTQEAPSGE